MGAPKQLKRFSVYQMSETLSLARETAMNFRSIDARAKALDCLRVSLLPIVEWLDKRITDCFPEPWNSTFFTSIKRALPLFKRFGKLYPIALVREGDWVMVDPRREELVSVSSGQLAEFISQSRHEILCSIPWPYEKQSLIAAESMGMKEVVEHCAFLKYIACGMEELDKVLQEREERLRTMRANFSFLGSFVEGIDPFTCDWQGPFLPGYALFWKSAEGGVSRSSGTYFVPGPVEEAVKKRNSMRLSPSQKENEYIFFNESCHPEKLESFLSRVCHILTDVSKPGQFGREPFSKEEIKVVADFIKGIGMSRA